MSGVLLAGFEPFDGEDLNPSWEAVAALGEAHIAGRPLAVRRLPVLFGAAAEALEAAVEELRPSLVLAVGLAAGRAAVSVERVALNLIDARIPDNAGRRPVDEPAIAGGPAAYFATVPVKAMVAEVAAAGIPAEVSHHAGAYVCNQVFYAARHLAARRHPAMGVGLIHVPLAPEQAARRRGDPSMAIETVTQALRIAVVAALAVEPAAADST